MHIPRQQEYGEQRGVRFRLDDDDVKIKEEQLPQYFRSDGWVKTAQGPAVPGALVYVCNQPANTLLPPTPLATIYSDVNGVNPIIQPLATDGFGHYDFYALAGVYTIIIVSSGSVQQVYPDQTVGNVGSTGLILQTNDVDNGDQFLLNIKQGANITITDDGAGNVLITGTPGNALSLKTNGVANGSQSLLDLVAGTDITLSDNGSGRVTITSTAGFSPIGVNWRMWKPSAALNGTATEFLGLGCNLYGINLNQTHYLGATSTTPPLGKFQESGGIPMTIFGDADNVTVSHSTPVYPATFGTLIKSVHQTQISNVGASLSRVWIGWASDYDTALATDNPASVSVAAFRLAALDANFKAYCSDGLGNSTIVDTGVGKSTSLYSFEIVFNGSSVQFLINGVLKATISTSLPSSTQGLYNLQYLDYVGVASLNMALVYWELNV
jgi:hypothetical protein